MNRLTEQEVNGLVNYVFDYSSGKLIHVVDELPHNYKSIIATAVWDYLAIIEHIDSLV